MQLPLRKSAAVSILNEYSAKIQPYVGDFQDPENQLLSELRRLYEQCEAVGNRMLDDLGIEGSTLQEKETNLNLRIREYQQETSFLNGDELQEFILRSLAQAGVFSINLQKQYEKFLEDSLGIASEEELQKMPPERFAEVLYPILQKNLPDLYSIELGGNNRITVRGRNKEGKFSSGTVVLQQLFDINSMRKSVLKYLDPIVSKIDVTGADITGSIQVTEDNLYSLLNLKASSGYNTSELRSIAQLLLIDPSVVDNAKTLLANKLRSRYQGKHKAAWEFAIEHVIMAAPPAALFGGANAQKTITGILGELQAMFYIKILMPRSQPRWIGGVAKEEGQKPSADIVFKKYGIQVKNTAVSDAQKAIFFENFKSSTIQSLNDIQWNKLIDKEYEKIATTDYNLFEAATQLLGLEFFNVPYIWNKESKKAEEQAPEQVPAFATVRYSIIKAAEEARKALTYFLASMMHMQMQPTNNPQDANTLYIVGGHLAITGASILMDVINQLNTNFHQFDFAIKAVKATTTQKEPAFRNIAAFFNAEKHMGTTQLVLESSYNFFKADRW